MAYEGALQIVPGLVAGADLSSSQFRFGKLNTSGKVVVGNAAGEYLDGVIQDKPDAADKAVALACGGVSKIVAGGSVTAGDRIMGDANGAAVTAAAAPTAASKDSSVGPFNLNAGDTMVIDVDNVGNATATWDAAAATITDTTTYPVTDQDGLTMTVTLTGGDYDGVVQTVTFSGATTTAAGVAAQMNAQLRGCSVAVVGGQVVITHDLQGTDGDIATGAGTGNLTWAASVAGTGDVGDINAVTAAEIETVIEADTTALVTVNADGSFTVVSPTTGTTSELDFISGNALSPCGLSVETINGASPGTYSRGRAIISGSAGEYISALLEGPTLVG